MINPYRVLARKRGGGKLSGEEIRAVVAAACDGGWSDAQLAAFLMATAIRGLDEEETRTLTLAMLESGEQWNLARDHPGVADKHSTGGLGDKVSLVLSPLLAACGRPVAMLTGRGLGHTGGTADKLEAIAGIDLALDRNRTRRLLDEVGMAMGIATADIAPADLKLYALRDQTATVESVPLITASILSKKLAAGAAFQVFDVKCGPGAFLPEVEDGRRLARLLVDTCAGLSRPASAVLTDMSQPLGRWVGHSAEVVESVACLEGRGPGDLLEVVFALCEEIGRLAGDGPGRAELERAVASGAGRERFGRWVAAQGGDPAALEPGALPLAPVEVPLAAARAGFVAGVEPRRLGLLLAEAGGGRVRGRDAIDFGVALEMKVRLGERVERGQELARVYLRQADEGLSAAFAGCFEIGGESAPPPVLVRERLSAG